MALRDQPYLPLYIQDIMTDEELNECSASTHGIYIKGIMCLMHKSKAYGKILLKQKYKQNESISLNFASQISKHTPYSINEIENAIDELLKEKVCYLDGDYLCQKRMIRDNEISLKRSEAGKKGGGNPNFVNKVVKTKPQTNTEYEIEYVNEVENIYNNVIKIFPENLHPKDKNDWYVELDKLIRIDKKNPDEIIDVITWTRQDEFWSSHFLSILKLRKKNREKIKYYDVFLNQMKNTILDKNPHSDFDPN